MCFPIARNVRPQRHGLLQVDVSVERPRRPKLYLKEHSQTSRHRTRNGNLRRAKERHVDPPHLSRREGGEGRRKVGGQREEDADDLIQLQPVSLDDFSEQLARRRGDLLRIVILDRDRPTDRVCATPEAGALGDDRHDRV